MPHKEVDLVPLPSRWSCAPSRKCRDVSSALVLDSLDHFLSVIKQNLCPTAVQEAADDQRNLYKLSVVSKLIVLLHRIFFLLIWLLLPLLRRSLHRVTPRYWKLSPSLTSGRACVYLH